jgi:hypothetical protein
VFYGVHGQVRHQCFLCKKSFREHTLAILHIRNRHVEHATLIPTSDFNWLGGLLKPQPSEKFKQRKAVKGKSKKVSPMLKVKKVTAKKDSGKVTIRSKYLSTQVCSLVNSRKATPIRARYFPKGRHVHQQIEDFHR